MHDDEFRDELRNYLQRRDARVRPIHVALPRSTQRSIVRMVGVALVVAVFVAGAIIGGFALRGSRTTSPPGVSDVTPNASASATPGTPAARAGAAIGFDPETGQVVMFGGLGDNGTSGDTWIWNGREWLQLHLSMHPLTRSGASMVFDPKLHGLVLVGGGADEPVSSSQQQDLLATWLWTGTGWRRLNTPHHPAPNGLVGIGVLGGPIAYDAATGRVVMVTNETGPHYQACSSETWTFDGIDWILQHPATPLPAPFAALVNEPQSGHVVAVLPPRDALQNVGKLSTSCPAGSPQARALPQSSTWRWTGSNWTEVTMGTEPEGSSLAVASNGTSIGLDPVSGTSMVVTDNNEALWSWNGARWTALPGSGEGPPPRTDSMLSIDARGHVVLFGGINQRACANDFDTWLWISSRWQKVTGPAPQTATPSPVSFTAPAG